MLSEAEVNYLKSQSLSRVATASAKSVPEVSPVGFEFDGRYFWIESHTEDVFLRTRRYRNIMEGNKRISIVIDDLGQSTHGAPGESR